MVMSVGSRPVLGRLFCCLLCGLGGRVGVLRGRGKSPFQPLLPVFIFTKISSGG